MQAIIMAGGKGTRLSSVTKNIPKPMVPIDGTPLLEYQIENLRQNGVDKIVLVIGHLGEVIQDYFGDGKKWGVNISYYIEETPLGTAGALAELEDCLEDEFFLVFGDLFININYQRFYEYHKNKNSLITLFAHPNSHPYDSDIIIADDDGKVIEWSYKNTERTSDYENLVNAGLYVMSKSAVQFVPKNQKSDLEKDVITKLIDTEDIYAYRSTEYVKDIGTPERLFKVETDYKKQICEKRNLRNKQKCIFLDRDGTINKYVGFLRSAQQLELEENVSEAIRLINESEYLAIVITNQPVIARGECTFEELKNINNRMHTLLGKEGAYLDDLYFCPHHPDSGFEGEVRELKFDCECRKPKIGMLERAAQEHNVDLSQSWFIGDTNMDVQTGINAGMKTVLLATGDPNKNAKYDVKADVDATNLLEAVRVILE